MIKALATEIEVITLFVEDLPATKAFYTDVFGLEVVYQDDVSAVVKLGTMLINLLEAGEAGKLVEPACVGAAGRGRRALLTIKVGDADTVVEQLEQHGVTVLNGPIDRPWGRRTAAFTDPPGTSGRSCRRSPTPDRPPGPPRTPRRVDVRSNGLRLRLRRYSAPRVQSAMNCHVQREASGSQSPRLRRRW